MECELNVVECGVKNVGGGVGGGVGGVGWGVWSVGGRVLGVGCGAKSAGSGMIGVGYRVWGERCWGFGCRAPNSIRLNSLLDVPRAHQD